MNKDLFDKYINIKDQLEDASMKVLEEIHYLSSVSGYGHLEITSIDDFSVDFSGNEYWRYGGHEHYDFSFPSILLYDEKEKEKYLDQIRDGIESKRLSEERIQERNKKMQEQKDFEKYKELKKQFEK